MIEVCSPIVSSTSHPELKSPPPHTMVHLRGNYPVRQQENNIGSIITMLIDDQVRVHLMQRMIYRHFGWSTTVIRIVI